MTDTLLNKLLERQRELSEGIVKEPSDTLHEYHRRVGETQGLQIAIDILLDMLRPVDEDD